MTNTETAGAGAAPDRPTRHDEALQRAGMVAIRMGREGDIQAAETVRAQIARIQMLEAENTTLQQGYAAARLEIESLQRRVQEVGAAARREHERADRAMRAAHPAGAQQPGAAYAVYAELPDERAAFEARFPVPGGVSWNGSEYVVKDDYLNSYRCDRFVGQWAAWQARASHGQAPAQAAPAYKDCTPELHVGDSAFESWYSNYNPAHKADKQRARDAYAAGMGDPLVTAAPAAVAGPSAITASIMRDDGGEQPAFCLMVAYRSEKDARAALAMIAAPPEGMVASGSLDHLKLMMGHSAFAGALQLDDALANIDEFARASLSANAVAQTPAHIEAMERAWLWMENQADNQSKGGHATFDLMMLREERDALRAAIDAAPTTQPAPQQEAQEPAFWTVCAQYEGGGETGWIPLPGYSNETEHGVKALVLQAARKEGYKGTATGRLMELSWEIRPVYLASWAAAQPSPASQGDALDAACQRACKELPEGMSMAIQLERDAGWIELHGSYGDQIELPNAEGSLAKQAHQAIDAARAAQEGK